MFAVAPSKRAAHRQGWQTDDFSLYGKTVTKTFKTFLASYPPVGGLLRVVWFAGAMLGWRSSAPVSPEARPRP